MSLVEYTPLNEEDKPIIEEIELYLKKIEVIVRESGKEPTLQKHALIRLFEAGIMCKECVKKASVFSSD